jgi:hypothetical protein
MGWRPRLAQAARRGARRAAAAAAAEAVAAAAAAVAAAAAAAAACCQVSTQSRPSFEHVAPGANGAFWFIGKGTARKIDLGVPLICL